MTETVASIVAQVRAGTAAQSFVDGALQRIRDGDGALKSFVAVSSQPRAGTGPLTGVAVGIKDIIDADDLPTGMGSPIYEGWQPRADAALVSMLKRAGATIIGKTATTAFAFLDPAPTLNPHDPLATPGGSSAGSAAAVAAGLVPLAVGTQTGGSVIRPASFCGVAAIKPSFGVLPGVGIKCFSWSLDTPGLFARSAEDLVLALAAITGRGDVNVALPLTPLRVGIVRQDFAGPAQTEAENALMRSADALRASGYQVLDMDTPDSFADAFHAHGTIQNFEAAQALGWEWATHRLSLPPLLAGLLDKAQHIPVADYDSARKISRRARDAARGFFDQADVILTYAAPGEAPPRDTTGNPAFNRLWTLLGTPCVTVPAGKGPRGLPVGVQIVARFGRDGTALQAARVLELAFAQHR
jgi:Asp-tRNA(Asn)/Glu-tRNA(Gln) amidotransferase A subunit family amidase